MGEQTLDLRPDRVGARAAHVRLSARPGYRDERDDVSLDGGAAHDRLQQRVAGALDLGGNLIGRLLGQQLIEAVIDEALPVTLGRPDRAVGALALRRPLL